MDKLIPICDLKTPARCTNRIDGMLSHIILCGGNTLSEDVKGCIHRTEHIYKEVNDG